MDENIRAIAAATRASHYRIVNGQIEREQVIWQRDRRFYVPEDAVRL